MAPGSIVLSAWGRTPVKTKTRESSRRRAPAARRPRREQSECAWRNSIIIAARAGTESARIMLLMLMGRLDGKVTIVTGGARGIGRAIVEVCSREGASVTFIDRDD